MHIITMVLIYLFLQMSLVWIAYKITKNPSIVDLSWPLGLMICGLIYLWSSPMSMRITVVSLLLIGWALRLAGYLWYTRIAKGHVDKRYLEISKKSKSKPIYFFFNFQFQGFLIFIIAFVFYWIHINSNLTLTNVDIIATIFIILAILGESIADYQLYTFKKKVKGAVCNVGLWNVSRHPNYFFDWLTWVGFSVFALQSNGGYFAITSPLVLYFIFTRVTGPITERSSLKSRGQTYIDYQNQTSMFFPWFKTKIDSE